ncbi:MAG TPA: hypothetical protein VIA18_05450, partial [Polyangia bacterium]|nr:hypothetical protein [Polyangia bacterium]
MRLVAGAPELVAADDQPYVVCAAEKLTLYDAATKQELASRPLPPEASGAQLGFVGDKLLAIVPGDGRTSLMAYSLPALDLVAQLELEERLRAVCFMPSRALVTTESFEQPRIVLVTSRIYLDPIAIREPVMLGTAAPEERLLVASRGRDQQLECWDPQVRRALFRLNLPLMPTAVMAGFASRRRILWIAGTTAQSAIEVYRYSDGRLQARVDLDAPVVGAAGHPESPRLIVATRRDEGAAAKLLELDFVRGERRELEVTAPLSMCVVESPQPMLVVHTGGGGAPEWIPLPHVVAAEAMKPT